MVLRKRLGLLLAILCVSAESEVGAQTPAAESPPVPYRIVDTGQRKIFSDRGQLLQAPKPDEAFFGQDGQVEGPQASYRDNRDGTISDRNTGLMWVKARGHKLTWEAAVKGAAACRVGGHADWRMPTIKELYSLIDFNGCCRMRAEGSTPYLDTRYFAFVYGDTSNGERVIDCQDWSATTYVSTTMNGNPTAFGVNFADGRIKGYPKSSPRGEHTLYVRYVRGNPAYGKNDFHDNADGTVSDRATGLMWAKADSGKPMNWVEALAWVQARNKERYLGHDDWRLPNAKELQSLVDYTRGPDAQDPARRGPAIDPLFSTAKLADGEYPCFWSSTTHLDGPPDRIGQQAVYVAFGRALGWMQSPPGRGELKLMDVHGAGAQRSDPKTGDPADYPRGRGPQGDVIRILNHVRPVRSLDPQAGKPATPDLTPLPTPRGAEGVRR